MPGTLKFFHVLFTFTFVAAILSAHWNALAARRTDDWRRRAALFEANLRVAMTFGIVSLVLLGVFGNLVSAQLGYAMSRDAWMIAVNALWLVTLLVGATLDLPAARRLAAVARSGSEGGPTEGFAPALGRWRLSNAMLLISFLAFVLLMVFRWRTA